MKSEVSLILVVSLVASALPIAAQAPPRAALSDFAWASLRTLKPGTEVLVTVRSSQPARRYLLRATESELTVLNLADSALPRDARRVLLDVASTKPAYFATAERLETFVNGQVRVGRDGVFVADRKVADYAQIVEPLTREAVVSIVEIGGVDGSPQRAVTSFEELRALVHAGDSVYVTDANGKTTKGKLGELSTSSLELLVVKEGSDGRRTLVPQPRRSERDVKAIQLKRRDLLWDGILIGLAPAIMFKITGSGEGCSGQVCDRVVTNLALIGGSAGALIDWARTDRVTIYQAPGGRSSSIRVSPLLSKSAAGVQMSVRF